MRPTSLFNVISSGYLIVSKKTAGGIEPAGAWTSVRGKIFTVRRRNTMADQSSRMKQKSQL
ncbi:unnamed protein product [Penicillium salamii]|nr:unnamed protein product [Penicillium salamii]